MLFCVDHWEWVTDSWRQVSRLFQTEDIFQLEIFRSKLSNDTKFYVVWNVYGETKYSLDCKISWKLNVVLSLVDTLLITFNCFLFECKWRTRFTSPWLSWTGGCFLNSITSLSNFRQYVNPQASLKWPDFQVFLKCRCFLTKCVELPAFQ